MLIALCHRDDTLCRTRNNSVIALQGFGWRQGAGMMFGNSPRNTDTHNSLTFAIHDGSEEIFDKFVGEFVCLIIRQDPSC